MRKLNRIADTDEKLALKSMFGVLGSAILLSFMGYVVGFFICFVQQGCSDVYNRAWLWLGFIGLASGVFTFGKMYPSSQKTLVGYLRSTLLVLSIMSTIVAIIFLCLFLIVAIVDSQAG